MALNNLDRLSEGVRSNVEPYCNQFIQRHGTNLRSIVLYGSAAGPNFHLQHSNINLMLVFEKLSVETLRDSLPVVREGVKKKIVAPLCLTREHIRCSQDVFPIEFLEMKKTGVVLHGEDVLKEFNPGREGLRLQLEREAKSLLIRLRQRYLELGRAGAHLGRLMVASLSALMPLFRTALYLKGKETPLAWEETIHEVGKVFSIDPNPFLSTHHHRSGHPFPKEEEAIWFFSAYLTQLERFSEEVDRLK